MNGHSTNTRALQESIKYRCYFPHPGPTSKILQESSSVYSDPSFSRVAPVSTSIPSNLYASVQSPPASAATAPRAITPDEPNAIRPALALSDVELTAGALEDDEAEAVVPSCTVDGIVPSTKEAPHSVLTAERDDVEVEVALARTVSLET